MTNNLNYWTVNGLLNAGTQLGIPDFTGDTAFHNPGIPDVTVSGFMTLGNAGANWYQDDTTWHGYDEVSYRRGSHNVMAGGGNFKTITGRGGRHKTPRPVHLTPGKEGETAAEFLLRGPAESTNAHP